MTAHEMNPVERYRELLSILQKKDRFVISTHRGPDHDGVGAEIGMEFLLRSIGKECRIVNQDVVHQNKHFMDPERRIRQMDEFQDLSFLDGAFIIGIDTSEPERLGEISRHILKDQSNLVMIDHHDSDAIGEAGSIFLFSSIGSSCEIVYELMELAGVEPTESVASAIYAGIVADTGSFRFSKTTPRTHEIAAKLLHFGVVPHLVADSLYSSSPIGRLIAKQKLYEGLTIDVEKRLAYFGITHEFLTSIQTHSDELAGIVNEPLDIQMIDVSILFYQKDPTTTKVSVRSKHNINMLPAVARYGGGGHKNACGATIMLDLDAAIREFIPVATQCIINQGN